MTLRIVLVYSLIIAMAFNNTAWSEIEPVGKKIGAVQFDAVIELNRYSSHSPRHDYTMMFARYWVSRDYYAAAVVWAEPQSTDLSFVIPPPTLAITSDKKLFCIQHQEYAIYNESHDKPLGKRGVLRHKFGGYPIGNIRFAEREALAERIYAKDLINLGNANQSADLVQVLSISAYEDGVARDVDQIRARSNGERIDSMKLFNEKHRLLKNISYEYESNGGKTYLCRQIVDLPERPVKVGFNDEGIKVTLDAKVYRYRDIEVAHHTSGRTCKIEYELVRLTDKQIPLPVQVTVCSRKDGRVLRSVRMMNFKKIELDAAGAKQTGKEFASFSEEEHAYRHFRSKYWRKQPTDVEKADIGAIRKLSLRLEQAVGSTGISTGRKLRYLHSLMELDRIIGDESKMDRHYQQYLLKLRENEFRRMMLAGGYGVIETSMFRGRRSEATKLLAHWLKDVLDAHDAESILMFSRMQLAKKRFWTTIVLLEGFVNDKQLSPDVLFEAEALRCLAIGELCKLVGAGDVAKKGLLAQVQANWVAHIGKEKLDTMLAKGTERARQSFALVNDPTESQEALKEQLNKIEQEISNQRKQKTG